MERAWPARQAPVASAPDGIAWPLGLVRSIEKETIRWLNNLPSLGRRPIVRRNIIGNLGSAFILVSLEES
jgi:hypothetical protein